MINTKFLAVTDPAEQMENIRAGGGPLGFITKFIFYFLKKPEYNIMLRSGKAGW